MILLEINKNDRVIKPLNEVTFNNLFARSVVEGKVNGSIYIDSSDNPKTFLIYHPYGMSLLFGETDNENFNEWFVDYALNTFKIRNNYEWLQAFPDSWNKKISELFGTKLIKYTDNIGNVENNIILEYTRVNFKFNYGKYLSYKSQNNTEIFNIIRTDKEIYNNMQGSVIPKYFWKDAEHFFKYGVGYSLIYENKIASTAYSAFIHDNQFELGIETIDCYRGKGFAINTCSALIDYCINNNYEPIWACRLDNIGSINLAQKLGFEPIAYIPFYRLIKE